MPTRRLSRTHEPDGVSWAVDEVRTYAVLGVVVFHAWIAASLYLMRGLTAGNQPQIGLDVFFVLSGLLVWRITRLRDSRPLLFLAHRATRIAPLYTLLTIACAVFLLFKPPVQVGAAGPVTLDHLLLSLLYIPHLSASGAELPVLGPGWTLVYDMFYFALFALVLAFPKRFQLRVATMVFFAPVVVHFVFAPRDIVLQIYSHPRSLSFLAGIWISEALARGRNLPARVALAVSLASVGAYAALVVLRVQYHGLGAALWMATAVVTVYATLSIEAAGGKSLRLPFSPAIARWSYAIYLVQALTIPLAVMFVPGPVSLRVAAAVAASLLMGKILHERVEVPLNRALKRYERRHGLGGGTSVTVAP